MDEVREKAGVGMFSVENALCVSRVALHRQLAGGNNVLGDFHFIICFKGGK